MKRRKPILWIAAVLLLVVPLALFLRKPAPLDLSKDEEPFRSMTLPPKKVVAGYYMDGGSVTVGVTDQRNVQSLVTFPYHHSGCITSYPEAFQGTIDEWKTGHPLRDPARAKAILVRLYRDYGDKHDEHYDFILKEFSEPPSVIGSKIYRKLFD